MNTMTEDEAKKKWCPMYRVSVEPNGSADNRGKYDTVNNYRCLASFCMAWQWDVVHPNYGYCGLIRVI